MDSYDLSQAAGGPGMCGSDHEVFARVWRRVMPVDTYGSPVQLIGEEPRDVTRLYDTEGGGPDPWLPEPPVSPAPPPAPSFPICLGPTSALHGAQLQEFIAGALCDCRCYLALSRRCRGRAAQTLAALAAEEKRAAKRLSAAYFLISGVRYWPSEQTRPAPTGPLPACLRQAFLNAQKGETAYREAAARTADLCLRELYLELAAGKNAQLWQLRGLLEDM